MAFDPIKTALKLMSRDDKEVVKAIKALIKALDLEGRVDPPLLEKCKFEINGVKYRGKATADHRALILQTAEQTPDQIEKVLRALLETMNAAAAESLEELLAPFQTYTSPVPKVVKPVLGACAFGTNGVRDCINKISQTQCENNYPQASWQAGVDCTEKKDS